MPGRHILLLTCLLGACSALPASGPTEREVLDSENSQANELGFHILDVTRKVVDVQRGARPPVMAQLPNTGRGSRADTIGPGDALTISVFEVGGGLFAAGSTTPPLAPGVDAGSTPNAGSGNLPNVQVDARGMINVPYIGQVRASGRTPIQLAEAIRGGLRRLSQDPQVIVARTSNLANTVIVAGDVRNPGRRELTVNGERLLDIIAISGGSAFPEQDTFVQLTRGSRTVRIPLLDLQRTPSENVQLRPQDRVQLVRQPRSYTVFGAAGKVAEIALESATVNLAEGIARSGGPANERADPNAVFLFRYEPPTIAQALGIPADPRVPPYAPQPVIYRLDMIKPTSYFLAQQFPMRDKDLIYIANARTDRLSKFVGIISQLATPLLIGRALGQ